MTFAAQYVRYPELFPARAAGERWGTESLVVDLPGGPYLFSGLSGTQTEAMAGRYRDCLTDRAAKECVETVVYRVGGAEFLPIDTRGWEYALDVAHDPGVIRVAGMNLMARVEREPRLAASVWTSEFEGGTFIGVIENLFRLLAAGRLLSMGALMLHSSGVVSGGEGILFVGRSGSGKSTIARLALESGREILSDDLNVLLPRDGRWTVTRLPFAGEYPERGVREELPLRAIFRLARGDAHAVEEMSAASGFASILECAPYVNVDPHVASALERVVARLIESVPPQRLTFRIDQGLWPIIETR